MKDGPDLRKLNRINAATVIDVSLWSQAEEIPTGSREKLTLIDPETGMHYIFKYPKEHREHQIWSELIASFVAGDLLGWDVQHTSIAVKDRRLGNLLGYVYEPGSLTAPQETFVEGWQFCTQVDPSFDVEKGTRHTLPLLVDVCDKHLVPDLGLRREEFMDFWARALSLDTLISNTDRHAENWAIIKGPDGHRMAALYDNGSSMGCGIDQVGLARAFEETGELKRSHLDKQRQNGLHHLRLDKPAKRGGGFEQVCIAFLQLYPDGRRWFEDVEGIDVKAVLHLMDRIAVSLPLDPTHNLSAMRRQHIYAMLQLGAERIRNVLDGTWKYD